MVSVPQTSRSEPGLCWCSGFAARSCSAALSWLPCAQHCSTLPLQRALASLCASQPVQLRQETQISMALLVCSGYLGVGMGFLLWELLALSCLTLNEQLG